VAEKADRGRRLGAGLRLRLRRRRRWGGGLTVTTQRKRRGGVGFHAGSRGARGGLFSPKSKPRRTLEEMKSSTWSHPCVARVRQLCFGGQEMGSGMVNAKARGERRRAEFTSMGGGHGRAATGSFDRHRATFCRTSEAEAGVDWALPPPGQRVTKLVGESYGLGSAIKKHQPLAGRYSQPRRFGRVPPQLDLPRWTGGAGGVRRGRPVGGPGLQGPKGDRLTA